MYTLITVLIIIAAILLVLIVLVQNSKGGGLASNFQSTNQVMGVRKTNDFLEKSTWFLAVALLVLSIAGSAFIPKDGPAVNESALKNQLENTVDPGAEPVFPTATPEAAPANQADSAQ